MFDQQREPLSLSPVYGMDEKPTLKLLNLLTKALKYQHALSSSTTHITWFQVLLKKRDLRRRHGETKLLTDSFLFRFDSNI